MRKSKCVWSILYRVSCVSLWGVQSVDTLLRTSASRERSGVPLPGEGLSCSHLCRVCAVVPPLGDARRPRRGEHHAASLRRVAGAYVFMSSGLRTMVACSNLFSFSPFTLHVSLEGLSATRYLSLSCRHPFFRSGRWASEASKARSAA